MSVGPIRQGSDLVHRVDGAHFGALGDRDHPGLDMVFVTDAGDGGIDQLGSELAVGCGHAEELAAQEPLGRAALVHVDVGTFGTDDRFMGAEEGLEPDDVGACPVEGEVDLGSGAEVLGEETVGLLRPRVGPIGGGVAAVVGRSAGGQDLGMDAGPVVAGEGPPGRKMRCAHRRLVPILCSCSIRLSPGPGACT